MKKAEVIAKIKDHVSNYVFQNQTISVHAETYGLEKGELGLQPAKVTIYDFEDELGDTKLPNLKGKIEVHVSKIGGTGVFKPHTFDIEITDSVFDKERNKVIIGGINFLKVQSI
jgi:hypothetical protein